MEPWLDVLTKLGVARGDAGWVHRFVPSMKAKGTRLGINFDFTGDVGNSTDSLRLLRFTHQYHGGNKAEELADRLATLHFEECQCVGSHETLRRAAVDVGIAEAEVDKILNDPSFYLQEVENHIEALHTAGVFSIPLFVLTYQERSCKIHGAASVQEFSNALEQIMA